MERRGSGRRRGAGSVAALLVLGLVANGCGSSGDGEPSTASPGTQPSTSATASRSPARSETPPSAAASASASPGRPRLSGRPIVGNAPPRWLGKRILPQTPQGFGEVRPTPDELVQRRFTLPDRLPALPGRGFAVRVASPAPGRVIARSTWRPGCPVGREELAWVRLTFRGFGGERHTGELLVNRAVTEDVVAVFRRLYRAGFPLEEMRITRRDELDAPPTGDGNNTGMFVCRASTGGSSYSQHAYGLAVDLNPFQNPYRKGDLVLPELASSYLERAWERPGMITANGPVVRAFTDIGWEWGGSWQSLKDYQHFSRSGR